MVARGFQGLIEHNIRSGIRQRDPITSYFVFNNIPVGQGTQAEFDNMALALDEISRNGRIVGLLSSVENSADQLENQITRIREMAALIMDLIDQELYDTQVTRCCPGLFF